MRGGERASTAAFLMEMRVREPVAADITGARFGLTITKKLGNAVIRNRIRRRLKAAIAAHASALARPDGDYVVVARPAAVDRQFSLILDDVERALGRLRTPSEHRDNRPNASNRRGRQNSERKP